MEDLLVPFGCGVLKLLTLGRYASADDGLLLEGVVGMLAGAFFLVQRLVF